MLPLNSLLSLTFKLEAFKNTNKMSTETYMCICKHLSETMMNSVHLYKIGQKLFADFEKSTNTGSDQIYMKEIKKNI